MYFATTGFLTPASASSHDDAAAYLTAASITDATEIAAVNQLVLDLKGTGSTTNNNNIWTKMNTIYPVSPTSLAAAAFNLKDPTSYNITWYNSPTHATTGVTGNGTNMYGDTGYDFGTEGMSETNFGLTYSGEYSAGDYAMGAISGAGGNIFALRNSSNKKIFYAGAAANYTSISTTSRSVFTGISSAADSRTPYNNGAAGTASTTTESKLFANVTCYVLAQNNEGVGPGSYFAKECDFWAIHQALTAGEVQDLYDAISTYNANVISGGR